MAGATSEEPLAAFTCLVLGVMISSESKLRQSCRLSPQGVDAPLVAGVWVAEVLAELACQGYPVKESSYAATRP